MLEVMFLDYRDRFKNLRVDNDLEQKDIARVCNVSHKTVSHWETHRREMPIDCIVALCRFYKVSSDFILGVNE